VKSCNYYNTELLLLQKCTVHLLSLYSVVFARYL